MLVTSIFCFTHYVFKELLFRSRDSVVKGFKALRRKTNENTVEKGENVGHQYFHIFPHFVFYLLAASPIVVSVADLRTGGRWFNARLGQYSFRGLTIVIATGFIPLSPLSIVSTMVIWESSQWLGEKILRNTGEKNSRKAWMGAVAAAI